MFDAAFYQALRVLEPLAPTGAGGTASCPAEALAALRVVRGGLDALEAGLGAGVVRGGLAALGAGLVAGLEPAVAIETLTTAGSTSGRQARKIAARSELLAS